MSVKEFLEIAYKLNLMSPEKIKEGYLLYQKAFQKNKALSIEQVFLQKKYLSPENIQRIYDSLKNHKSAFEVTKVNSYARVKSFGRYQIVEELGRGGMGIVYKAYDRHLNIHVALKIIGEVVSSEKLRKRFEQEARLMAKLSHANIIRILDAGCEQNRLFIAMELIQGESLDKLLKETPLKKLIKLLIKISLAIHHAHEKGIIHRDLKPSNIMIDKNNEPKVMDFGLAKEIGSGALSKSMDIIGTPQYMSPEQIETHHKDIDKRTDVYALGIILYEMITGKTPFTGEPINVLYQISYKEPISPSNFYPNLSTDLEAICLKCIEKNIEKRYINAKSFSKDLASYLEGKPVKAKPLSLFGKSYKIVRRHKVVSMLFACIFILLSFIVFDMYREKQKAKKRAIIAKEGEVNAVKKELDTRKRELKSNMKNFISEGQNILSKFTTIKAELRIARINITRCNYEKANNILVENQKKFFHEIFPTFKKLQAEFLQCKSDIKKQEKNYIKKDIYFIKNLINTIAERMNFLFKALQDMKKYCIVPCYKKVSEISLPKTKAHLMPCSQPSWRFFVYVQKGNVAVWDHHKRKYIAQVTVNRTNGICCHSPDGKYIVFGGVGYIIIFNTKTRKMRKRKLKILIGKVEYLEFSKDSTFLVVRTAYLRRRSTYVALYRVQDFTVLFEHKGKGINRVSRLFLSANKKWLGAVSDVRLRIFNLETFKLQKTLSYSMRVARFGRNDEHIIGGNRSDINIIPHETSTDGKIIFDKEENKGYMRLLNVHRRKINDIEVSPNQFFFATLGEDGKLTIWNALNYDKIFEVYSLREARREKIHFHPVQNMVGIWSKKLKCYRWNANLKRRIDLKKRADIGWSKFHTDLIKKSINLSLIQKEGFNLVSIKFSPYGRYLTYYSIMSLYLFDMEKDEFFQIAKHPIRDQGKQISFSKDNRFLLWRTLKSSYLIDIKDRKILRAKMHSSNKRLVAFRPQSFEIINYQRKKRWSRFDILEMNGQKLKHKKSLELPYTIETSFFRKDGKIAALASRNHFEIWDINTARKIGAEKSDEYIECMTFIGDNRVAIGQRGEISLYNYVQRKFEYHTPLRDNVREIYYDAKRNNIWVRGYTSMCILPDRKNDFANKLYPLPIYPHYQKTSMSISPDFSTIAFIKLRGEIDFFDIK